MPRNFLPGLPRNPPTPTAGFGGATRVWLALVGQSNAQGVYQSTTYTGTAVRSGCDVIYNGSTITAWDTVENGQPVDASAPGPAPHFIDALLDGGLGLTAATVVVVANGATFVTNVRTVQLTQLISTLISEGFDPDTDRLDCVFFSGEWEASAANSSAQIAADFQDDLERAAFCLRAELQGMRTHIIETRADDATTYPYAATVRAACLAASGRIPACTFVATHPDVALREDNTHIDPDSASGYDLVASRLLAVIGSV